jgi:uncharacterized protein YggE
MQYTACLFLLFLFACKTTSEKQKSVKVSGEGKVRVMPDLVILTMEVSFVKPRMADAVSETQQTVDSVLMILEQFGQKNTDIKTSSISANKEYNYAGNRPVFTGFKTEQSIDFVLNDIDKFTGLTGKLLQTKINSISGIQFGHSKADSLFREADLLAYDDAFKSATKLCNRAGVHLGKLLYLSNAETGNSEMPDAYTSGNRIDTYSKAYGGRGFRISPEVLEFRRTVVSEYEVSP